ncbi:MAG: menaquinone biosynthesis protein [Phycisphaerales bacterium]|nr:menaquinone biosynthesis protein [Phycisphaerales bacterium]
MLPVRIGCVQYLNTLPLIEGLRTWKDCALSTAVPSKLFGMLTSGEVDVALASVIDAASLAATASGGTGGGTGVPPVCLLPVGMIGCDGPTLTVRLFSRTPIESLERVSVDRDSHTSVALLHVLMHRKYHRRITTVEFEAHEHVGWPDAVLLIGDKVVTDAPPGGDGPRGYPYQLDLGAAWKELTGLPFVYAVWMCRAGEESSRAVTAAAIMLDRARRRNVMRMDWLVAKRAAEKNWPADLAAQYLGDYLRFAIDEPEVEAVGKFLRWANELGLCPLPSPRWAELRAPEAEIAGAPLDLDATSQGGGGGGGTH